MARRRATDRPIGPDYGKIRTLKRDRFSRAVKNLLALHSLKLFARYPLDGLSGVGFYDVGKLIGGTWELFGTIDRNDPDNTIIADIYEALQEMEQRK